MKSSVRKISVTEAQAGDVIGEPIPNDEGRVLLPKGAKLSPAVLSRLAGWGVESIEVEGEDPDAAEDESPAGEVDLDHRFGEWEDDELMMAIKQIARRHLSGTS